MFSNILIPLVFLLHFVSIRSNSKQRIKRYRHRVTLSRTFFKFQVLCGYLLQTPFATLFLHTQVFFDLGSGNFPWVIFMEGGKSNFKSSDIYRIFCLLLILERVLTIICLWILGWLSNPKNWFLLNRMLMFFEFSWHFWRKTLGNYTIYVGYIPLLAYIWADPWDVLGKVSHLDNFLFLPFVIL